MGSRKSKTNLQQPVSKLVETGFRGKTFFIRWDNRVIPKCKFTTVFLGIFWIIWAPATFWATSTLFSPGGPHPIGTLIWLIFGYAGTILIPFNWIMRYSVEELSFEKGVFKHTFEGIPGIYSKEWPLDKVTKVCTTKLM